MVKQALIIAAGNGSRFHHIYKDKGFSKPLLELAGVPLIERVINSVKSFGINDFVVITGYNAELVEERLKQLKGTNITFVRNEEWTKPNGLSVLKAKDHIKDNFLLLMSDHIFDNEMGNVISSVELKKDECCLLVDKNISTIFDIDDATKVKSNAGKIEKIGKELTDFDCIDTGVFVCTPNLFTALEKSIANNKCSLSGGIQVLSEENLMKVQDIGSVFWQDVDTPEAYQFAEDHLYSKIGACKKGFLYNNFYKKVSLELTKFFIRFNISAFTILLCNFLFGLATSLFILAGGFFYLFLSAILLQFNLILNNCYNDQIIVKSSHKSGRSLFYEIVYDFTYLSLWISMIIYRYLSYGDINYLVIGFTIFALFLFALYMNLNYFKVIFQMVKVEKSEEKGLLNIAFKNLKYIGVEEFLPFTLSLLILINGTDLIFYFFSFLGLITAYYSIKNHKSKFKLETASVIQSTDQNNK